MLIHFDCRATRTAFSPTHTYMAKQSKRKKQRSLLQQVCHPNAAGIDIAAEEIVVAVPEGRDAQAVRSFGTFNDDLRQAVDWLLASDIQTVAMESTGNYWVPLYDFLQDANINVCLVNARHVKGVPGRKTDVQDAQWLQQLHTAGLLNASFVPDIDIRRMRYLYRQREDLIRNGAREIQHMQKAFNEMNVQLHHVISDIDGLSGRRIIEAIIEGHREPLQLAMLRHSRCKTPLEDVLKALDGNYCDEYVFVLRQAYERWKETQRQIAEVERFLGKLLQAYQVDDISNAKPNPTKQMELPMNLEAQLAILPTSKQSTKHEPNFDVRKEACRIYKTDLSLIPGVSSGVIGALLTEVGGADAFRERFRSGKHFASWLGLCPDNRISGNKLLGSKTRPVTSRLAYQLRMGSMTLWRNESAIGDYCRRMKAKLGKAEGITATAHKLARIIYALITEAKAYEETVITRMPEKVRNRRLHNLKKQAEKLGMQLVAT